MKSKGINNEVKNDAMAIALRKSGYKLLKKRVAWPRLKGPATVKVDCSKNACKNAMFAERAMMEV